MIVVEFDDKDWHRKSDAPPCAKCSSKAFCLVLPEGEECMLCLDCRVLPYVRSIWRADYYDPKDGKLYVDLDVMREVPK